MHHDLIIVGGGASGLVAAITAKDFGMDVAIVEGSDRIGKKILTTGNGRCNISNNCIKPPFINYHSSNSDFKFSALEKFSLEDTKNFFFIFRTSNCISSKWQTLSTIITSFISC